MLLQSDFLSSYFINEEELSFLFQRYKKDGLKIISIIIRPCPWQLEPILTKLQVLPKDGKPIITFSENNGDRDQIWTDIAMEIIDYARIFREK